MVFVGLGPGEMLLESIRQAIADKNIQNGVVVSGIGALKKCRIHYVLRTGFPSKNEFLTIEKPLELASVSGIIADGEPHLHVVVSHEDKEVYAGHLEDGSEVAYLAEIAIMRLEGLSMHRALDDAGRVRLLTAEE
jgi:predicted DNA-binding protein with PD1-like motif